jgi:hypothetical protein
MKTYAITGYQAYGTGDRSAYYVDVSYRGIVLLREHGEGAADRALRYVSRHAGKAVIVMGDRA